MGPFIHEYSAVWGGMGDDAPHPLVDQGSAVPQREFASNRKEVEEASSLFLDIVLTGWKEPRAEGGLSLFTASPTKLTV